MNKKIYETPKVEVIEFITEDILTTSQQDAAENRMIVNEFDTV